MALSQVEMNLHNSKDNDLEDLKNKIRDTHQKTIKKMINFWQRIKTNNDMNKIPRLSICFIRRYTK